MNDYQQGFKKDILNAAFNLTKRIWLKVTVAYTIQSILAAIVFIPVVLFVFNFDLNFLQQVSEGGAAAGQAMQEYMESIDPSRFLTFSFIGTMVGVFIVVLLITSWGYNLFFLLSDQEIRQGNVSFPQVLSQSFNQNIFRLLAANLLIGLVIAGGVAITAVATGLFFLLGLLLFFGVMLLFSKFILTFPAIVHENRSVGSAISYSFKHITFARAVKVMGVGILLFVGLIVMSLVVGAISMIFNFIPVIGPLVNMAVNILFGGLVMTFIVALISGLYFRYASSIENGEPGLEEHLISDE